MLLSLLALLGPLIAATVNDVPKSPPSTLAEAELAEDHNSPGDGGGGGGGRMEKIKS